MPDTFREHVDLMLDLQVLAFMTETTRVSSFKMARDVSSAIYPESGVKTPFHGLSHHGQDPKKLAEFAQLNQYHVSTIAPFLEKLKNTPDGDGNLLDHSLVLYGSPMGDSHLHEHKRVPVFLAGHASGAIKGNLHLSCPDGTPMANLLLTIGHRLGVDDARADRRQHGRAGDLMTVTPTGAGDEETSTMRADRRVRRDSTRCWLAGIVVASLLAAAARAGAQVRA